jgi:hypothetical protein
LPKLISSSVLSLLKLLAAQIKGDGGWWYQIEGGSGQRHQIDDVQPEGDEDALRWGPDYPTTTGSTRSTAAGSTRSTAATRD